VVAKETPNHLLLRQGSLWGVLPRSAKKTVDIQLEPCGDQTRIQCFSRLSNDWKNVTLVGCVLAAIFGIFCAWMASDLTGVLATKQSSFWSWLIIVDGYLNSEVSGVFIRLVWGLAGFLLAVIALETAILVYAHLKIDEFAIEVIDGQR